MALRTIDLIALGSPTSDPYDPSATAWALARAYATRGDDVRVIRPEGPSQAPQPEGVASLEITVPLRRPGAAVDQAAFASEAGRHVRPTADVIVRDPSGLGAIRARGRSGGHPPLVAFVRLIELHAFDRERGRLTPRRWTDRLDTWRDRRDVRRFEKAALTEADVLFVDAPGLASAIATEYVVPAERVRTALPPVPDLPPPASRDAARAMLDIPRDVPVAVSPVPENGKDTGGVDRARETFRRIRPLFPGARLIIVGASPPTEPGLVAIPRRDAEAFGLGFAAANVALFAQNRGTFDPMVIGAMRAGCAVAAVPSLHLPVDPGDALKYAPTDDPGDLASILAELFADPALARETAAHGVEHSALYHPDRIVRAIDEATSKLAP